MNGFTLVRNLLSSCAYTDKFKLLIHEDFLKYFMEEMEAISILYEHIDVNVVLYMPDYTDYLKKYNVFKTNKASSVLADYNIIKDILYSTTRYTMPTVKKSIINLDYEDSCLFLTNQSLDLISTIDRKVDLLESNTGRVKNKFKFNTKYHKLGKRDLTTLPFNDILLYIFGDTTLIKPLSVRERIEVFNLSTKENWDINTSSDKIMNDIRRLQDVYKKVMVFLSNHAPQAIKLENKEPNKKEVSITSRHLPSTQQPIKPIPDLPILPELPGNIEIPSNIETQPTTQKQITPTDKQSQDPFSDNPDLFSSFANEYQSV